MTVINSRAFKRLHGIPPDEPLSLSEIARLSGMPRAALQEVYDRGIGAWKTNPTSVRLKGSFEKNVAAPRSAKLGKEQWAMARVYSFVMRRKTTFGGVDQYIAEKYGIK
jgi:hypothetical protein